MITAIEIENFKGFGKRQRIELAPITFLFGANSAGKSSLFQALFLLREIFEDPNAIPTKLSHFSDEIELGGFQHCIHNQQADQRMSFKLHLTTTDRESGEENEITFFPNFSNRVHSENRVNFTFGCDEIAIEIHIAGSDAMRAHVESFSLFFGEDKLVTLKAVINNAQACWDIDVDFDFTNLANNTHIDLPSDRDSPWTAMYHYSGAIPRENDPILSSCSQRNNRFVRHDKRELEFAQQMDVLLIASLKLAREALNDLLYIGPIRAVPSREFEAQLKPAKYRWANGLAAWDCLHFVGAREIERVNNCLGANRLNLGVSIQQETWVKIGLDQADSQNHLRRLSIRPVNTRTKMKTKAILRVQDVGFGISQVLPVVVALVVAKEGTVLVEQPELHLHPKLQTELGDLFISTCLRTERPKASVIETHSEHLILRILRRIREAADDELPEHLPAICPEDVAVNYFDRVGDAIVVTQLRINSEGEFIDNWPHGFFDERIGEMYG